MYYFVDRMENILTRMKRLKKLKSASAGTNSKKIHLEGFILKIQKRLAKEPVSDLPYAKAQRSEEGSLSVIGKAGAVPPSLGGATLALTVC